MEGVLGVDERAEGREVEGVGASARDAGWEGVVGGDCWGGIEGEVGVVVGDLPFVEGWGG